MRSPPRPTLLFLAATPSGATRLGLDAEARAIQAELERGERRQFALVTRWAVTPLDLLRELGKLQPTVVHFAGHGGAAEPGGGAAAEPPRRDAITGGPAAPPHGLVFHGPDGEAQLVPTAAVERAFAAAGRSVRLVVLNACYSAALADALLHHADCVVGMTGAIRDDAARAFAVGFYGALGDGAVVAEAFERGVAAIGLAVLDGLPEADHPQLRLRREPGARLAAAGIGRRILSWIPSGVRLGVQLAGGLGVAAACAALLASGVIAWHAWFALGGSTLDVRVRQLTVQSTEPPQPVQDSAAVRAVEARASIEGEAGVHRVSLTGRFAALDYAHPVPGDPACRVQLAVRAGGLAVDRARPDGTACPHQVVAIAGAGGLVVEIDDERSAEIRPADRVVLRIEPGTPVSLIPRGDRLALFRPSDLVIWPARALEGVAADGDRVRLPGGLRGGDSFALAGGVELRELRLDGDRLAVLGELRAWHGSVGRGDDWDAAAPWPRGRYAWLALGGLIGIAAVAAARAHLRWRGWETELG